MLQGLGELSGRPDGWLHPDFVPVAKTLRLLLRRHKGGAAVCVYHRGQCVVDLWGGVRNRAGALCQKDTMAPSFSTTKGVASKRAFIWFNNFERRQVAGANTRKVGVESMWPILNRASVL